MKFDILDCYKKHWKLHEAEKLKFDQEIYENFIDKIRSLNIDKYFLVYWSQENEPDTEKIISYLLSIGKKVCLLHIDSKKHIEYLAIENLDFKYDYLWNMKMPKPKFNKQVTFDQISCVVLPTIACNNENAIAIYPSNELFIPFLKNNQHAITISLAYKFSIYNDIKFDNKINVNMVIHNS